MSPEPETRWRRHHYQFLFMRTRRVTSVGGFLTTM